MFGLFGKKNDATSPTEPKVLLEEVNPHGTLQAVVEATHSTIFLYLAGREGSGFGMRSLWIGNLTSAPDGLDEQAMQRGEAPMNPAEYCLDPAGRSIPDASALQLVWLPESNGVALFEGNGILGIIPPWSGESGFHGYASEAKGTGPLAWELDPENVLIQRFRQAQAYWRHWKEGDPWERLQTGMLEAYEQVLGQHSNYYAIDGGKWPPKALVRIAREDAVVLVTLGVSLCPQPNVERSTDDPKPLRRVELGAVVPASWDDEAIGRFGAYLSAQSSFPWQNFTWLGPGHTIGCDVWRDARFTAAALWHDHPAVPNIDLPPQFGDPTHVLWFLPLTDQEQGIAEKHGSAGVIKTLPPERWKQG